MGQWEREGVKQIIITFLSGIIMKGAQRRRWAFNSDGESVEEHV